MMDRSNLNILSLFAANTQLIQFTNNFIADPVEP